MEDLGVFVEFSSYAMAAVVLHHAMPFLFGHFLDGGADVPEASPRANLFNSLAHASVGEVHQVAGFLRNLPHQKGFVGVSVKLVQTGGHINIEDIAFFQDNFFVRNPVANHVVGEVQMDLGKGCHPFRGLG